MFEMRERLVRIETKMDASGEKIDSHETRLSSLEKTSSNLQSQIGMLKWFGGAIVTLATLFGNKLLGFM